MALGLQPANVEAHSGYGALLVARGRASEALREFSTAVELGPEYPDAHYNLGRVLAALGRPTKPSPSSMKRSGCGPMRRRPATAWEWFC